MAWILSSLRRLRQDRAPAFGLAVLALVTAFAFALAPRVLDRVADEALRNEVAAARPAARNIRLIEERRIVPRDGVEAVRAVGERLETRLPARVRALLSDRGFVVESPRWLVRDASLPRSTIRLRWHPGVESRLRLVEGAFPTGATATMDAPGTDGEEPVTLRVLEAALPAAAAELLRVAVGDRIELLVDATDRLAIGHRDRVAIDIVGIYETRDETDEYWLDDLPLTRPSVREINSENAFFDATALLAPESYPVLVDVTREPELPLRYEWRYFVDPGRLDAATIGELLVEVRRMETLFPATASPEFLSPTTIRSGLVRIVETQRARWAAAEAILMVVGIGPAAVAAAALALVALLAAQRGRAALALARGRGASSGQWLAAVLAQGLVLTVPAAALAVALAIALLPGAEDAPSVVAAVAVAATTTVLLIGACLPAATSEPGARVRDAGGLRRTSPRRLAFEAMVVGVALLGIVLLRDRGLRVADPRGAVATADPFIAAVPALAGLAAGLVAVRLFPLPMRLLAALARLRRDLVPVLAMRRVTRGAGSAPVLLVLLGAATVGTFAAATLSHLDRSSEVVAWHETGGPFRLDAADQALPDRLDPAALPGVERVAGGFRGSVPIGERGARVELLALDVADYLAVVAGTPADPGLPIDLRGPPGAAIPAIVSIGLAGGTTRVAVGDTFDLSIAGGRRQFRAIEARDTFPSLPLEGNFVVVSRDQLEAAEADLDLPTTSAWLAAPDGAAGAIRAAVTASAPGVQLASRAERSAALRGTPVAAAVRAGVGVAAMAAAAYAALGVTLALALAGAARAVEVAHLRTLGLSRRETLSLVIVEHGPTVVVAFAAGAALGLGLFVVLRPGLGFDAIVGSGLPIPLSLEAGPVGLVLAAVVAIAAVGIGLAAVLQRRGAPVHAIRRGFE